VSEVLEQLLAVADLDTAVSQLQRRRDGLVESSGLRGIESQLATLEASRADAARRRDALGATQQDLEAQIAALTERRDVVERRMYAATGSSARDLQAMNDEVAHLTQRRAELEELELAAMLDQEPVDAELARLSESTAPLWARAEELRAAVARDGQQIDAELEQASERRAAIVATLPPPLAERYDTVSTHVRGAGAARLVGIRCAGCHLELSSVEVERIRALPEGEIATCEQCGRLLVPA
jgi:predicted  nucleic acid-binding Zn-ribbon protein